MKKLICPVSNERVPEHLPRVTAFYVIGLMIIYMLTLFTPLLLFVLFDFIMRGFGFQQYSPIHFMARKTSELLKLKGKLIEKAPKIFAARLGVLMVLAALILDLASIPAGALAFASGLVIFATLECVFNFCLGCYVYTYVVLPLNTKE